MSTGGPIQEFEVDGRLYQIAADADAKLHLGGYENELEPNGDGSARVISKVVLWKATGLKPSLDTDREDLEALQAVSDGRKLVNCSFKLVDSTVYGGKGIPTGEIGLSVQSGTGDLTISGSKKLEKQ